MNADASGPNDEEAKKEDGDWAVDDKDAKKATDKADGKDTIEGQIDKIQDKADDLVAKANKAAGTFNKLKGML